MIRHLAGLAPNMRGALFMVIAMAGFSCNDAMIKLLALDLDLYQAIFLRGMVVTTAFTALAAATGGLRRRIGARDRRALTGRTLGEILGAFCFLTALTQLPMANATAILQSMPLAITLAAAWMLNEPVGWRRYAAIAVGFLGVLVIVRPGSEGIQRLRASCARRRWPLLAPRSLDAADFARRANLPCCGHHLGLHDTCRRHHLGLHRLAHGGTGASAHSRDRLGLPDGRLQFLDHRDAHGRCRGDLAFPLHLADLGHVARLGGLR